MYGKSLTPSGSPAQVLLELLGVPRGEAFSVFSVVPSLILTPAGVRTSKPFSSVLTPPTFL